MAWHCKATYGYTTSTPVQYYPDADGQDNVLQIYYILKEKGWTTNAICGLVTCIALESGYNPWRWENNHIMQNSAAADADNYPGSYGYGLVQWTPASYMNTDYYTLRGERPNKYINNPHATSIKGYGPNYTDEPGSLFDGYAQIVYLDDYGGVGQYFTDGTYYGNIAPTYYQFKESTAAASDLCETWVCNFERPADPSQHRSQRQALAAELYNWLSNEPVLPPDKPAGFPVWLLLKWRQNQINGRSWL